MEASLSYGRCWSLGAWVGVLAPLHRFQCYCDICGLEDRRVPRGHSKKFCHLIHTPLLYTSAAEINVH